MLSEQAQIPQLPGKQGRTKEPRSRPPALPFSTHGLEENSRMKPTTGTKSLRGKRSRDLWAAYRRRRADLTRGGGEEDPEASAAERTADLRRIFRLFLASKNKGSGEEREREGGRAQRVLERRGVLDGDEVESRVWEVLILGAQKPLPGWRFSAEGLGFDRIMVQGPAVYLGFRASSICIVVFCSFALGRRGLETETKLLGTSSVYRVIERAVHCTP